MTTFPHRPHRLRSREELTAFIESDFIRGGTLDMTLVKRYLSSFGSAGVGLYARLMTDRGRALGLRYRSCEPGDGTIQILSRRSRFPFTPTWQDLSLPSDVAILQDIFRIERVFCDGAVTLLDHPY